MNSGEQPDAHATARELIEAAVEELTGRRVLTYHSQVVFDPPRTFEIFVLEPHPG